MLPLFQSETSLLQVEMLAGPKDEEKASIRARHGPCFVG
jgi:hypothetical protein